MESRGFTLIELMVVIVIILVLTFTFIKLINVTKRTKLAKNVSEEKLVIADIEEFTYIHKRLPTQTEFEDLLKKRGIEPSKYTYTIVQDTNPITEETPAIFRIKNHYLENNLDGYTEKEVPVYE